MYTRMYIHIYIYIYILYTNMSHKYEKKNMSLHMTLNTSK